MADAPAAAPTGTSSTPPATVAPAAPAAATAAPTIDPKTTPTSEAAAPVSPEPVAAPAAPQDAAPTEPSEPEGPLFTLPDGIKLAPEATTKFETFLKGKLAADGKVVLTSQEVADHFIDQAKDANARWMKQIEAKNAENEAACKKRFTATQLSQAESAVGWASSIDPGFREFAKGQLNDPVFVNFMREIGERLSEDEFERGTLPSAPARKGPMTRAEAGKALYAKSMKTN
jgi:hypothetical protein